MYSRPIMRHDLLEKDVAHKNACTVDEPFGMLHQHSGEVGQTKDQPGKKECGDEVQPDNESERNRAACDHKAAMQRISEGNDDPAQQSSEEQSQERYNRQQYRHAYAPITPDKVCAASRPGK